MKRFGSVRIPLQYAHSIYTVYIYIYIYIYSSICVLKLLIISEVKFTVKCTDVRLILDNKIYC